MFSTVYNILDSFWKQTDNAIPQRKTLIVIEDYSKHYLLYNSDETLISVVSMY